MYSTVSLVPWITGLPTITFGIDDDPFQQVFIIHVDDIDALLI